MSDTPILCVIYAAKSTEDKHGSIPDQLARVRAAAEAEGRQVLAEFQDEGFSGFKGSRGPALAQACALAEEHQAELWVLHSDRLARGEGARPGDATHLLEYVFWARRSGVHLRSVEDDSMLDNLVLAASQGERNAEDSRRKSQAVKAGVRRRVGRGERHGGPLPFGYRFDALGDPTPDRFEATVVRRMFREYVGGKSQLEINRGLRKEGVPTKRGGQWHQGTVRQILANPFYAGKVPLNGEEHPGTHEAIVAEELWRRAQAAMSAHRRGGGGSRGRPPRGRHLFRNGLLRCGNCGAAMIPRSARQRTGGFYDVYRCYGRATAGVQSCSTPPIPRLEVDHAVFRYFRDVGFDVDATRSDIAEAIDRTLAETRLQVGRAQGDLAKLESHRDRIKHDYRARDLSATSYEEMKREVDTELRAAREELARLEDREREVSGDWAEHRADDEVVRLLSDIRRSIIGEIHLDASPSDPPDDRHVESIRASLRRLFEEFVLFYDPAGQRPDDPNDVWLGEFDEFVVAPRARPEVLGAVLDRLGRTTLGRVPLAHNYVDGLVT